MIVVIASQKGGSGKSTTALNIAVELHARGRAVLIVDADAQGSITAANAARETPLPAIAATAETLEQLPDQDVGGVVIMVDCPGHGSDTPTVAAAVAVADLVLIPTQTTGADLRVLGNTLALIASVGAEYGATIPARVVMTRVGSTVEERGARAAIARAGAVALRAYTSQLFDYSRGEAIGQGAREYAPGSKAAAEVAAIVDELFTEG